MNNNIETTVPKQEKTLWVKGSDLVGLNHNPCENPNVQRAKELCAELADLLNHPAPFIGENSPAYQAFYKEAMIDILKAEMMVTKLLTFK